MKQTSLAFYAVQTAFSRQLVKYPWQLSLALLGVSIGIAVIVAIQLVRVSAYESFEQATLINSGYASHQISPRRGSFFPYELFVQLKTKYPHIPMSPVLQFTSKIQSANKSTLHTISVIGIEPISQANRSYRKPKSTSSQIFDLDVEAFISDTQFAAINHRTSNNLQVSMNESVVLTSYPQSPKLAIRAILPSQDRPGGLTNNTLLVDIATAQQVLGDYSAISHIDIDLNAQNLALIQKFLPKEVVLTDIAKNTERLRSMTQAFYTNLTALSLMALMMGVFLIYNTEAFLVLQRQQMIARLKALGVTNKAILHATLAESAFLGFIGSIIGVLLGYFLAKGLLQYVSITLNDLYFKNDASSVILDPILLLLAISLGVVVTMCAGFIPAKSAATSPLVHSLHRVSDNQRKPMKYYRRFVYFAVLAFTMAGASLLIFESINGGFFAIACSLLGFSALCVPALCLLTNQSAAYLRTDDRRRSILSLSLFERIGIRTTSLGMGRASTAAAALMIATAAGIGIGVMVASFRISVADWLTDSLRAEFYVSKSFSLDEPGDEFISSSAKLTLENLPEVESVSTVRRARVAMVDRADAQDIRLSAFELNNEAKTGFNFLDQETDIWNRWQNENTILITEPFSHHNKLNVSDKIKLLTDKGEITFTIVGVYKDYASEQGGIVMNRRVFDKHWNLSGYSGLGIYSSKSLSLQTLENHMAQHEALIDLTAVSSDDLFRQSLEVFDRTFLITNLLKFISIVVAFIGIVGALLAQQLERSQEYGIYRALGLSRTEILRIVLAQTLSIGFIAALIAVPAGLSVAWILIEVVNPRSFGWTMTSIIPISSIVGSFLIAIAAALIAGVIPALRISKLSPAQALRYE